MNDVAIFLDLDNLVIGAKQAKLSVDLHLLIGKIAEVTNGRLVLLRAYGDNRQAQPYLKPLTELGFDFQSVVRMNTYAKNLADMKIVVEAMETLLDGHSFQTYVFITGDRDFTPMVQVLRKRGKYVLGIGVRHTTSQNLSSQCDRFIHYEEFLPKPTLSNEDIEELLSTSLNALLEKETKVRASILKQRMNELSRGSFIDSPTGDGSFRKFLENYPDHVNVVQEDTTTFVSKPSSNAANPPSGRKLHQRYRSELKKKRLRIVPAAERFTIIRDIIQLCQEQPSIRWKQMTEELASHYKAKEVVMSKNLINDTLLITRKAQVLETQKSRSLSTATLTLNLPKEKPFKEAIIRCDAAYLREIISLSEPFEVKEATIALYGSPKKSSYIQMVINTLNLRDN